MSVNNFIPKISYGPGPTSILFDYPPESDDGEQFEGIKRENIAISGTRQVSIDHTEVTRNCTYNFLSKTLLDQIQTFFDAWGKFGKSFTYYPHQNNLSIFFTYELLDLKLNPVRLLAKNGDFLYTLPLTFRRFY